MQNATRLQRVHEHGESDYEQVYVVKLSFPDINEDAVQWMILDQQMHVNTSYRKYSESHMIQRYEEKACRSMMMTLTLDIAFLLQAIGHRYTRGSWVFGGIYD